MISRKLKERNFAIKATPLPDRAVDKYKHRRGENLALTQDGEEDLEQYDTFFDYEEDLADLKPSGQQYAEMVEEEPYVVLEEKDDSIDVADSFEGNSDNNCFSPVIMIERESSSDYTNVVGFEFIQCGYTKKDGQRCKRQAPKGEDICSIHRKYIKKHTNK